MLIVETYQIVPVLKTSMNKLSLKIKIERSISTPVTTFDRQIIDYDKFMLQIIEFDAFKISDEFLRP